MKDFESLRDEDQKLAGLILTVGYQKEEIDRLRAEVKLARAWLKACERRYSAVFDSEGRLAESEGKAAAAYRDFVKEHAHD